MCLCAAVSPVPALSFPCAGSGREKISWPQVPSLRLPGNPWSVPAGIHTDLSRYGHPAGLLPVSFSDRQSQQKRRWISLPDWGAKTVRNSRCAATGIDTKMSTSTKQKIPREFLFSEELSGDFQCCIDRNFKRIYALHTSQCCSTYRMNSKKHIRETVSRFPYVQEK